LNEEVIETMPHKILITPRTFARYDARPLDLLRKAGCELILNPFGRVMTEEELVACLPEMSGVIVGLDPITDRVLHKAGRLQAIAKYGAGTDNIDLRSATRRGIIVANTPGANSAAVAELAIGLMLAVARHIAVCDRGIRAGRWESQKGFQLGGKTLGILGTGRIGRELALRARGFDMRLLCYDISPDLAWARQMEATYRPLEDILSAADIVSLHLPLTAATHHIISADALALMKKNAILINTARGEHVDEKALGEALAGKRLAGAGLDVWETKPEVDTPLAKLENTVLTAHIGAHSREAAAAMGLTSARNLISALAGNLPEFTVNPEVQARLTPKNRTGL
jgi:D-3-phosphoglycerate dehydrogenase